MNEIFNTIKHLILNGQVRISEHGYDELSADNIFVKDVMEGIERAVVLEEYPDYPKGPCVLALQWDKMNDPLHVVWGIPKGHNSPAVLVTSYRPDSKFWNETFTRRIK